MAKFCNPEIPGLRRCQSRDSGLAKTAGIPGLSRDCNLYFVPISLHLYQYLLGTRQYL